MCYCRASFAHDFLQEKLHHYDQWQDALRARWDVEELRGTFSIYPLPPMY